MSAPERRQLEAIGLSATCADVLRHLWDYLDDQVTPQGAERLRAHVTSCATCQGYEAYQECFLEAVSRLRVELGAPGRLRERLAEGLKEQGCGCWEKAREGSTS